MKQDTTQNERLNEVVEPFRTRGGRGLGAEYFTAFELEKSNFHDSKSEFLEEKKLVENGLNNAEQLLDLLLSAIGREDEQNASAERIFTIVQNRAKSRNKNFTVRHASDLVRKNASEIGLPLISAYLLHDLYTELKDRLQELEDQEKEYWSGNSRPPNHYARTIALRFARFILHESGQKPTIGTSSDGNYPSTDYGRALEKVFNILGIRANFKRAGTWAISQLTEADAPQKRSILGGLAAQSPACRPTMVAMDMTPRNSRRMTALNAMARG